MNFGAIFHDECHDYLNIVEPSLGDDLEIKIRVGKDKEKEVYFLDEEEHMMDKYASDEYFEYYKYNFKLQKNILRYAFCIQENDKRVYYSKIGI